MDPKSKYSKSTVDAVAKFRLNCFAQGHAGGSAVVGMIASRINHSCEPNAVWRYDNTNNKIKIRAIQHIPNHQEVLLSYVPVIAPVLLRAHWLLEKYDFKCECDLCKEEAPEGYATIGAGFHSHLWELKVSTNFDDLDESSCSHINAQM